MDNNISDKGPGMGARQAAVLTTKAGFPTGIGCVKQRGYRSPGIETTGVIGNVDMIDRKLSSRLWSLWYKRREVQLVHSYESMIVFLKMYGQQISKTIWLGRLW